MMMPHKSVWNCVGAAGSNFCMPCLNAWAKKRQRKAARSDSDPDSSDDESTSGDDGIICEVSTTAKGMDLATDDDIREKLDKLDAYHADPTINKTQFTKHEQTHT